MTGQSGFRHKLAYGGSRIVSASESVLHITYVFQNQYPWDVRVEKVTTALSSRYNIEILSRNRDGLPVREQLGRKLSVHRLPAGIGKLTRTILNFPAFFSPIWLSAIASNVKRRKSRLIIVRDLPLGPAALVAARLVNVPVIMDMAEDYPAMIRDTWRFRGPSLPDYLIRNPYLLAKLERWLIPKLDGVLVVSNHSRQRVACLMGECQKPIWVVGNTPELSKIDFKAAFSSEMSGDKSVSKIELLYIGGLEESRGLQIVIESIPHVVENGIDILFTIVGDGTSKQMLKKQAVNLQVANRVRFTGWVPHDSIYSIINKSDICIVPHHVTEHIHTTLPNKIFDYMMLGKPVITTNSKSLQEIVETCGCGRVYKDRDSKALAKVIIDMSNPNVRRSYGLSGFEAVKKQYNWEKDKEVLFKAVNQILLSQSR